MVLNVEDLFLGHFDVIKICCLRDVCFQQLVFAPVRRSRLHMVISPVECASSIGVGRFSVQK